MKLHLQCLVGGGQTEWIRFVECWGRTKIGIMKNKKIENCSLCVCERALSSVFCCLFTLVSFVFHANLPKWYLISEVAQYQRAAIILVVFFLPFHGFCDAIDEKPIHFTRIAFAENPLPNGEYSEIFLIFSTEYTAFVKWFINHRNFSSIFFPLQKNCWHALCAKRSNVHARGHWKKVVAHNTASQRTPYRRARASATHASANRCAADTPAAPCQRVPMPRTVWNGSATCRHVCSNCRPKFAIHSSRNSKYRQT